MERGSLELGDGEPRARIKKRTHEIGDAGETGAAGSRGTRARRPGAGEPRKPGRTDKGHVKSDVIRGPLSLGARSAPVPASHTYILQTVHSHRRGTCPLVILCPVNGTRYVVIDALRSHVYY